MPSDYSEDQLVQRTMADYLEQQLGWRSVYAYNQEDFGPDSLLGRLSDREIVLTRILREKLVELNQGLPAEAYDDAVRQITQTDASATILATNRDKYALLLDGVQASYTDNEGQRTKKRLRVFDFNDHTQNDFLCVRELWIRGDLYRKRADVIPASAFSHLRHANCVSPGRGMGRRGMGTIYFDGGYCDSAANRRVGFSARTGQREGKSLTHVPLGRCEYAISRLVHERLDSLRWTCSESHCRCFRHTSIHSFGPLTTMKLTMLYVLFFLHHNSNKDLGAQELAPWLADATAVIPYFYGARGNVLWSWEPQSNDTQATESQWP